MRVAFKPTATIAQAQETVTDQGKQRFSKPRAVMIRACCHALCPWWKPWWRSSWRTIICVNAGSAAPEGCPWEEMHECLARLCRRRPSGPSPSDEGMLSPYRVLDLTDERGLLCGKILADLGADVIQVEPSTGNPARRIGPFYQDEVHPERSLFWWAYTSNKRSITLNLTTADGRALLKRLIQTADFLIESGAPGEMGGSGTGVWRSRCAPSGADRGLYYTLWAGRSLCHVSGA